jgi:hypothetical protein
MNALVPLGINAFIPADMDQAIRLAQAMASSKMVPKHLQGDAGTCLMIIEQSLRWQMSPFAVAQCTSSIGSKLMFEGKLVAAAVESSGAIEGGFDYKFEGEGDARRVTVSARRRGETNPRQMTIHLKDVRTTNEWWKKQPDQMLVYSGTRNWARRWTPAVILGVYAPEEFDRAAGKVVEPFTGVTIDAAGPSGGTGATGAEPAKDHRSDRREQINAEVPLVAQVALAEEPLRKVTWAQLLDSLALAVKDAGTVAEIDHILRSPQMVEAKAHIASAKPETQRRFDEIMVLADERRQALEMDVAEAAVGEDELPEVHIAGEEMAASG